MKYLKFSLAFFFFAFISCSGDSNDIQPTEQDFPGANPISTDDWLIDTDFIIDAGPGLDGIPALVNPETVFANQIDYVSDDDLIIGISNGTNQLAIPHKILDWHEIVNLDNFGSTLAVVYCPLTGTGIGWNTEINNTITTFGVSGLLYKNNIVPYDRATGSNWSQLTAKCVNGELIGSSPETTVLVELSWGLWKTLYPDSRVLTTNTGHSRQYALYPYGGYRTDNEQFIYPIEPLKNNVPAKERVYVINDEEKAKVYRFSNFEGGKIIRDQFQGKDYLIIGNADFIVSFELDDNTRNFEFTYEFNGSEIIMTDDQNNEWNIFGQALSGPNRSQFLKKSHSGMMSYYFSVESFYEGPEFYE
ncbi:DUF3179 domain-containing protein [Lutimonas sp.]|uniref:DUF3179 domain-containing protein n=1 Tax=Lutimonas sp. TaxID=1872403 RepID=UPI003D9BEA2A